MPETRPPIDLKGLSFAELETMIAERRLPPVERWNPEHCGKSDMRIARDGTWYHQGAPIAPAGDGAPVLDHPAPRARRQPRPRHPGREARASRSKSTAFRAVEMISEGEGKSRRIALKLDSGDVVVVGRDHPLRSDRRRKRAPARASSSATGSRPSSAARSITSSPRSRWPRAPTRPASGATAPSSRWTRPNEPGGAPARGDATVRRARTSFAGDLARGTGTGGTPAAVLVAITDRPEPGVILTVRREHLRTHAGQVAFPGGRIDPGEDAVAAALREAQEEIALDPRQVAVVGTGRSLSHRHRLPRHAGRRHHPARPAARAARSRGRRLVRGAAASSCSTRPTSSSASALFRGRERHYYEIEWEGRSIWGATAAMIVNLSRRLRGA